MFGLLYGSWKPVGCNICVAIILLNLSSVTISSSNGTDVEPHRYAVLRGASTPIISCSTQLNLSIAIYFRPTATLAKVELYDRYELINGFAKKFNMTTNSKHFTLNANRAEDYHAGEYFCYNNEGIGELLSHEILTILDPTPNCSAIREEESSSSSVVILRCEFWFVGMNPELVFRWSENGVVEPTELLNVETTIFDNSVVSTVTVSDSSPTRDRTFICSVVNDNDPFTYLLNHWVQIQPSKSPGSEDQLSRVDTEQTIPTASPSHTHVLLIVAVVVPCTLVGIVGVVIVFLHKSQTNPKAKNRKRDIEGTVPHGEDLHAQTTVNSVQALDKNDPQATVSSDSCLLDKNGNCNEV